MDFFISYNSHDSQKAEWIAHQLEEAGYTTIIQAWDFRPGLSFPRLMRQGLDESKRIIAVWSQHYFEAEYTHPEWEAAFVRDPSGDTGTLVLVRVSECEVPAMLRRLIYIDLVGADEEESRKRLLDGVKEGRAKPESPPPFFASEGSAAKPRKAFQQRAGATFMAELPRNFVDRAKEMDQLLQQVVDSCQEGKTVCLYGAGGFGKTTLAAALCDRVRGTFEDRILWATLGVHPDLRTELNSLYFALTDEVIDQQINLDGVAIRLSECLRDKRCLMVIDDVWERAHLKPFIRGGKGCVRLITTRRSTVAKQYGDAVVEVDSMTISESIELLTDRLDADETSLEPFRHLARCLGECPLALELANAALRQRKGLGSSLEDALKDVMSALDQKGVTAFDRGDAEGRNEALAKTIEVSLDFLDEAEQLLLFQLATFPEDISAPRSAVQTLWQMKAQETDELLMKLHDLALVKYNLGSLPAWPPKGRGWFKLHDVLRDFYTRKLTTVAGLQERLGLLTRVMPLNGFADGDFAPYHRCAVELCSQIPVAPLREDSCQVLATNSDRFVNEKEAPDLWNALNRIGSASSDSGGFSRILGKFDLDQSNRGLFLADSGVRVGPEADPTCIVNDIAPDARKRLWQNFILLTNTAWTERLCLIEYFNEDGCVMLRFILSFPGRSCLVLNAFDSILPGTAYNSGQRFFGEEGVEPYPIPVAAFGDGRFLVSIKTLRDDPQSLLTLPSSIVHPEAHHAKAIGTHYAIQAASRESTAQRVVRTNNIAFAMCCAQEHPDSAEPLLLEALQLAEECGYDEYAAVIHLNLFRGPQSWRAWRDEKGEDDA